MRKLQIVIVLLVVMTLTGACVAADIPQMQETPTPEMVVPTPQPTATLSPAPIPTTPPDETHAPGMMITVRDGDTLERDIIPQIVTALNVTELQVKEVLAKAQSELISGEAEGFRRMEGIIPPGSYEIGGKTLDVCVQQWVSAAEMRYQRVVDTISDSNSLSAAERLTLGSIVEWETMLADDYEEEVAAAFLNRLDAGDKLRSCATTEYALGYTRPYLTRDDIKIENAYNTYITRGLPPGPICVMDDESLAAASAITSDGDTYYFFYDYAIMQIIAFAEYDDFKAAGKQSTALFEETFEIGRWDKIDKRQYFGS